jgi:hypothetical protein
MRADKVFSRVGAAAFLAHLAPAAAFRKRIEAIAARLASAPVAETPMPPPPPIIQSYTQRAASDTPVPDTICLHQCAEMRTNPGERWRPITAEQVISVRASGFVWLARMRLAPLLSVRILDCYVGGEGLLEVRLLGLLRLARATGPQTSRGELMRYLAELAWAPHAMRHNPHLSWREIDATTVEVSAESAGGPARVRLVFANGDIGRIEADDRPRLVGGRTVPTRWCGRFFDYREMNGCRIPTGAEVSWVLKEGPFECWRGRVTAYELRYGG